jgi:steroid delta-isomerase-like uncharacterized protein
MTADDNKSAMRRLYEEVISSPGELSRADEFLAVDIVEHEDLGGGSGLDAMTRFFKALRTAFPDYHIDVEELIAEGDRVVARIVAHGTHQGEFLGVPPTGRRVRVPGIDIMRFEHGKAVEHWGVTDALGLLRQIGGLGESTIEAMDGLTSAD